MVSQNDDVGMCLMTTEESEAIVAVLSEQLGAALRIDRRPTYVRLETAGGLEVDLSQVSEVLGREFTVSDFQMIFSTYYGRVQIGEDTIGVYAEG